MDAGKRLLSNRILGMGLALLLCFSMMPFSLADAEECGEEGSAAVAYRYTPTSDEIDWDSMAAGVDYEKQCMLVIFVPDISLEDAWTYIENQGWEVGPTSPVVWDEEDGIKCLDAYVPEGQPLRDAMREAESSDLVQYVELNYYSCDPTAGPFEFTRLAGDYALDTMAAVVSEGFPDGSDTVIVARMDSYYDALSAAGLAGVLDCPVLMTDSGSLSPQTEELIGNLGASRVIIAGGPSAVSGDVERQIIGLPGVEGVERVWGDYARDTARAVYEAGAGSWGGTAIVCTADSYLDAMAASPYAFAKRAPIFLTDSRRMLDAAALAAIASGGFSEVIVMGGTSAVSPEVEGQLSRVVARVSRMAGDDAYETASLLADRCLQDGMHADGAGVTTALAYYDALCAGPVLGRSDAPVLYANKGHADRAEAFFTANAASIEKGYVLGGYAAVSKTIEIELRNVINANVNA